MAFRIEISIPALRDAETAFLRIREYDPELARAWYEGLLEAVVSLEESPYRCSRAAESEVLGREIRQMFYGRRRQTYRIFFEIFEDQNVVRVYRIRHTSTDRLPKEEFEG